MGGLSPFLVLTPVLDAGVPLVRSLAVGSVRCPARAAGSSSSQVVLVAPGVRRLVTRLLLWLGSVGLALAPLPFVLLLDPLSADRPHVL